MKSVLLVHEQDSTRGAWRDTLTSGGYKVNTLASSLEALSFVLVTPPDAVIIALRMPQLDGLGLVSAFRAQQATAPIPVIITALPEDQHQTRKAMRAGADDFLIEPVNPDDLLDAVSSRIARREAMRGDFVFISNQAVSVSIPEKTVPAGVLHDIETIGDFRILHKLAEGGMSKVYLARQAGVERPVVLKVMRFDAAAQEGFIELFIQEHALLESLSNPRIVKIYGQGITDDYAYLAMEYFAGGSLRQQIALPALPRVALETMIEISEAVAVLHSANLVHRDLKPDNVMFRIDGSLAITDFGIARNLSMVMSKAEQSTVLGTPSYMAPEQALGRAISKATDIYALGAMLYELLTGQKPYSGSDMQDLLFQHVSAPIPSLPAPLSRYQELIDQTMDKNPATRLQDAHAFLDALRTLLASESMELDFGSDQSAPNQVSPLH